MAEAATVTEAGTARTELVLVNVTTAPPVGAGCVSVTLHVLVAFGPRLEGLQASDDINTGATRPTVAFAEVLLYEAVRFAVELLLIVLVVAENVAVVAAAATVTEAWTARTELVLVNVTTAPPVGAGCVSVTVHVLVAFGPRLEGLQARVDTSVGGVRLIAAFAEVPL